MNHVNSDNICPVCGYDRLEDGTASGEICSSCGTEFGYSDFQRTHEELRQRWISNAHAQWWSRYTPRPLGWSPVIQLSNIGYECTQGDLQKINAYNPLLMGNTRVVAGRVAVGPSDVYSVFVTGALVFPVTITQNRSTYLNVPKMKPKSESYSSKGAFIPSGLLVCLNS